MELLEIDRSRRTLNYDLINVHRTCITKLFLYFSYFYVKDFNGIHFLELVVISLVNSMCVCALYGALQISYNALFEAVTVVNLDFSNTVDRGFMN